MPTHRLPIDGDRVDGRVGGATLRVRGPLGEPVIEFPADRAHQLIDLCTPEADGKLGLRTDAGQLTFAKDAVAVRDARGLRDDADSRDARRCHARLLLPIGVSATSGYDGRRSNDDRSDGWRADLTRR